MASTKSQKRTCYRYVSGFRDMIDKKVKTYQIPNNECKISHTYNTLKAKGFFMGITERIAWINRSLQEGHLVTARKVSNHFEVSEKTAKRDIEYLRDRCEAPIVWNTSRHSYEYERPWHGLDFLDEHSLLAAAFLKAILGQFNYIPVVADSLEEEFVEQIPISYRAIVDSIVYSLPQFDHIPDALVFEICTAIKVRRLLHIVYSNSNDEQSEREIEPRKLVNYGGKWYTIAYDHHHKALRTFALNRIISFSAMEIAYIDESITGVTKDMVEDFVTSTYGIYKGDVIGIAVLRFYGRAASNVKNTVWHTEQISRVLNDDKHGTFIELSLPVHDYPELLGRALRCGASCEVVAPLEFRDLWKDEIRRMSQLANDNL